MGMIRIKEHRYKDSGITEFAALPYNPFSKYHTLRIKFGGKDILHSFKTGEDVASVLDCLVGKLHGFLRVGEYRWVKASTIKRYEVCPDVFKIKINQGGKETSIKLQDKEAFDSLVEYLDKSFGL